MIKILLSFIIISLVLVLPQLVIKEFIVFDTYSYSADAMYLIKNNHISWMHRLGTTPGYALVYASLSLVSGMDIFKLVKIYPIFIIATFYTIIIALPRQTSSKVLVILLTMFFMYQPINFHRSTMFLPFEALILFLLSLYLRNPQSYKALVPVIVLVAFASSSTYSMTLIFSVFLIIARILLYIPTLMRLGMPKLVVRRLYLKPLNQFILVFSASTLAYYTFYTLGGYIINHDFQYIIRILNNYLRNVLISSPIEGIRQGMWHASGLTNELKVITILRLGLYGFLLLVTLSMILYYVVKERSFLNPFPTFLSCLWITALSGILIASVFLHYKLFILKEHYMTGILSIVTIAILFERLKSKFFTKFLSKIIFSMLIIAIMITPLTSYASLPITHPSAVEMNANIYVLKYSEWRFNDPKHRIVAYGEYSAPWNLDALLTGEDFMSFKCLGRDGLANKNVLIDTMYKYPIIIVSRLLLRDYYIVVKPNHNIVLWNAIKLLNNNVNLLYYSRTANRENLTSSFAFVFHS